MKKIISILIALALVLSFSLVMAVPVAAADTWYVDPTGTDDGSHGTGTGTDAFKTIQYAIDQCTGGDTINVAAGTYAEAEITAQGLEPKPYTTSVQIDKALTLRGANADVNPVTGTREAESIIDAGGADRAVNILGNLGVVTFDGFTVRNFANQGICHRFYEREGTTVHVLNNIVIAPAVAAAHGNSIQVSGDNSTVIGNDVSGALLEDEFWGGTAILVIAADNVVVRNNSVHNCGDMGIAVAGYGPWGGPAISNIIEHNTVQGCGWGIDLQNDVQNTIIRYNNVLNNGLDYTDGSGIATWKPFDVTPSGTKIHFNNIVGNGPYGVISWDGEEIDATCNWWGDASGPDDDDNIINGTGDKISTNVDADPYLTGSVTQSVTTATNTGTASFSSDGGALGSQAAVAEGTLPTAGKPNINFPHGFFSFDITGLTPGDTVIVTITLPPGPTPTQYWKYHPITQGGWVQIPMTVVSPNVIRITLIDGGLGDDDGAADGTIVDQGGPGNPGPVGWEPYPISKVRVLLPWIALFAAIVVGASLLVLRRRRAQS